MKQRFVLLFSVLFSTMLSAQSPAVFNVDVAHPGADISPSMWGIFFEDINMGADGGLYSELVKNRSFEFNKPLMGWKEVKKDPASGSILIENRQEKNAANPRFAHVTSHAPKGEYGLVNEGFRGMGLKKDLIYDFSVWTGTTTGNLVLHAELLNAAGEVIGAASLVPVVSNGWNKQTVSLQCRETEPKGSLRIWFAGNGSTDVDMISLFPTDTWKNRPGGLRGDLVQLLADMKPGFMRFPGGCIVEGHDLSVRYQWKKTIGPVEERTAIINRWNYEFAHRPTPDYYQSFGLGFFEYFQMCEDMGAEPLPILNCGMACQFNTSEVVPLDQLDPYVQDALDLIEFANGDATTAGGKLRAQLGHPAPFGMELLGVGNEQWGEQYVERFEVFQKAIKSKYPEIRLVSSAGPGSEGEQFRYLSKAMAGLGADIVDEHYYQKPEWFLQNAGRYDAYDRNGPKIFAGEYAAQSDRVVSMENKNNWRCALAEAAFMTGLERNADLVRLASYAPLMAHVDGWQWKPDMIWMDNLRSFGTPNYYVQKMYSTNRGDRILPVTYKNTPATGQDSLYASAAFDKTTNEAIVKIVNASGKQQPAEIMLAGAGKLNAAAKITLLQSNNLELENSLDQPMRLAPVEQTATVKAGKLSTVLAPYSFAVFRIKLK
ncbi:MAG TPA: alpha-L-arabinofuranosidase C-terminal domain-containing protein [Saprospiraceae bacterium]|nr:alpha-L-arabinofuranosidase C-terminal domain-containing protein [Saprospiraceae bacterium]HPI05646.1 alpha-L-arabinofuranosidase C-terminal domain-containing protein [Saprospiraceae bacterium]